MKGKPDINFKTFGKSKLSVGIICLITACHSGSSKDRLQVFEEHYKKAKANDSIQRSKVEALYKIHWKERLDSLQAKILNADTVIIVSHSLSSSSRKNRGHYLPEVVEKGRPNKKNIVEQRILNDSARSDLAKVLCRLPGIEPAKIVMCFDPHHAIYLLEDNHTSFLNICFTCQSFATSKDINLVQKDFNEEKWRELESFFKRENISISR